MPVYKQKMPAVTLPGVSVYMSIGFLVALTLIIAGPLAYSRYNEPSNPDKQKQFNDTISVSMIIIACLLLSPIAYGLLNTTSAPAMPSSMRGLTASVFGTRMVM